MEIMHQVKVGSSVVAIGRHERFDIHPDEMIFAKEKEIVSQLSPRKKSEWLASRELLFRIADLPKRVECLYDDFGKPYLIDVNKHISVSHSAEWASAMISDEVCGVDIQVYSDTVERISERFLSENELSITAPLKNRLHQLHLLWGAKECMYKAYGRKKLEFRQHIHIRTLDAKECKGTGKITFEGLHLMYEIHYRLLPEAAWVFCFLLTPGTADVH